MISWAATGDTASWVGAVGTWFVGLVAGLIAWLQHRHNRFWPDVVAYRDGAGRIAVRIINKGAGVGSVEDVALLGTKRPRPEGLTISYRWEIDGQPAAKVGSSPYRMRVSVERTPRRPTTVRRPSAPAAEPEPPRR